MHRLRRLRVGLSRPGHLRRGRCAGERTRIDCDKRRILRPDRDQLAISGGRRAEVSDCCRSPARCRETKGKCRARQGTMTKEAPFDDTLPPYEQVGYTYVTRGRTITESDILTHAGQTGDLYPLHMDAEAAKKSAYRQRVAH